MRVLVFLLIKYTCLVKVVDANLPGAMDDLLVAHDDAHMGDMTILLAEESQITGQRFLQEIHQITFFDLLRGVAGKEKPTQAGTDLHHARTVDAHRGATAPKIRCAK